MLTATDPTEVISDAPADLTDDAVLPCWTTDPDLWFAESPADVEAAKALCVPCPLRALHAGCGRLDRSTRGHYDSVLSSSNERTPVPTLSQSMVREQGVAGSNPAVPTQKPAA